MDFTNTRNGAGTAVTQVVTMELIDATGSATPLQTELSYNPRDPLAVSATFSTVGGDVRWTFGRDLLIGGMHEPTGDGDVHVWPCTDNESRPVVIIELCSPDGEALVQARTTDIRAFVGRMTAAVAVGAEESHLDVDAAIMAIFAADAA